MLIILLLVCISEFTFFMDAQDDFPDRLNTSITLILASVAFLYVACLLYTSPSPRDS